MALEDGSRFDFTQPERYSFDVRGDKLEISKKRDEGSPLTKEQRITQTLSALDSCLEKYTKRSLILSQKNIQEIEGIVSGIKDELELDPALKRSTETTIQKIIRVTEKAESALVASFPSSIQDLIGTLLTPEVTEVTKEAGLISTKTEKPEDLYKLLKGFTHEERVDFLKGNHKAVSAILKDVKGDLTQIPQSIREALEEHEVRTSITTLELNGTPLTFQNLMRITTQFPMLKRLDLRGCDLTDASLKIISQNLTELAVLHLENNTGLTDAGLHALTENTRCENLHTLSLAGCFRITDIGVDRLAAFKKLEELNLAETCVSDESLPHLAGLPLRKLSLEKCLGVTDKGIESIAEHMQGLQELVLNETLTTDKGLQAVSKLSSLHTLSLRGCQYISDQGLKALVTLTSLEELNIESCQHITARGVTKIDELPSLLKLDMIGCSAEKELTKLPKSFAKVEKIDLSKWEKLAPSELSKLSQCTEATSFKAPSWINEAGRSDLTHIAELRKLEVLDLSACPHLSAHGSESAPIREEEVEALGKLTTLTKFILPTSAHDLDLLILQTYMPHLEEISLDRRFITCDGIQSLAKMPHLQKLTMTHCPTIDLKTLSLLLKHKELKELNLKDGKLSQSHANYDFSDLGPLHTLNLEGFDFNKIEIFAHLAKLPTLEILSLDRVRNVPLNSFDIFVDHCPRRPPIKQLNIKEAPQSTFGFIGEFLVATQATVEVLNASGVVGASSIPPNMPHLKKIIISATGTASVPVSDFSMKNIGRARELEELDISSNALLSNCLVHLRNLHKLHTLNVSNTGLPDDSFAPLSECHALKRLNLGGCRNITGNGMRHLRNLSIQTLDVQRTQVGDTGIREIATLSQLSELHLGSCPITSAGLAPLAQSKLRTLDLEGCIGVSDAGLEHIKTIHTLKTLNLAKTSVGNRGLTALADLSQLEDLSLEGPSINDDSCAILANLRSLTTLRVKNSQISDAGLQELQTLHNLTTLDISQCGEITERGISRFKRARPDVLLISPQPVAAE